MTPPTPLWLEKDPIMSCRSTLQGSGLKRDHLSTFCLSQHPLPHISNPLSDSTTTGEQLNFNNDVPGPSLLTGFREIALGGNP